jgi:hypothetical protein
MSILNTVRRHRVAAVFVALAIATGVALIPDMPRPGHPRPPRSTTTTTIGVHLVPPASTEKPGA